MKKPKEDEIEILYKDDVRERKGVGIGGDSSRFNPDLYKSDLVRKNKILDLYRLGKIKSPRDFHHAALILQHGETVDDYRLAHKFAEKAVNMGDESAKWLFAATLDRYLLSLGKAQKFGTQFRLNKEKEWELVQPTDESVTDEERLKYNVPPLNEALEKFKRKYQK